MLTLQSRHRLDIRVAIDGDVDPSVAHHLAEVYGCEAPQVMAQRHLHPSALERIHPDGPDVWAQAYHAVEHEWAVTVDDVVRRHTTLAVRGLASAAVRAEMTRFVESQAAVPG